MNIMSFNNILITRKKYLKITVVKKFKVEIEERCAFILLMKTTFLSYGEVWHSAKV